jgi:hypothetical protein
MNVLKLHATEDTLRTAAQAVVDSWPALQKARTTKLEYLMWKALTKPSLTGNRFQKALTGLVTAYSDDTKKWHKAADPGDHVWAPLWVKVKPLLG